MDLFTSKTECKTSFLLEQFIEIAKRNHEEFQTQYETLGFSAFWKQFSGVFSLGRQRGHTTAVMDYSLKNDRVLVLSPDQVCHGKCHDKRFYNTGWVIHCMDDRYRGLGPNQTNAEVIIFDSCPVDLRNKVLDILPVYFLDLNSVKAVVSIGS